jgi:hypothetical protein
MTVTGDSTVRRELYTDSGLIVSHAQRPVLITTVGLGNIRPDLATRLVTIRLRDLPTKRPSDQVLDERYYKARPRLLGALLEFMSDVFARLEDQTEDLAADYRMVDFARRVAAVDAILDTSGLQRLDETRRSLSDQVIQGDEFLMQLERV